MNKELKDMWVTALRSGKYHQTKGILKDEVGFCCLGVLCDVVEHDGWTVDENDKVLHPLSDSTGKKLNHAFKNEIALTAYTEANLIEMNDGVKEWHENIRQVVVKSEPQPFEVIANYIEENL